jgi:hypothetical protein
MRDFAEQLSEALCAPTTYFEPYRRAVIPADSAAIARAHRQMLESIGVPTTLLDGAGSFSSGATILRAFEIERDRELQALTEALTQACLSRKHAHA